MTFKRNLVANFLGQGWIAAMTLAFVPVYLNRLGVEAYALIGFYAVLQGWLALLDLGMTPTITREMARASAGAHTTNSIGDLLRSIEVMCFGIATAIGGAVWCASGWLALNWFSPQALSREAIANAIAVMALVIGSRFCEGIYRGALFGMERQVWYNSINAALATLRYAGAAIIVVWISPTIEAFFLWQALVSLGTLTIFAIATHHWLPASDRSPRFSYAALKSVAAFAGGLSLTTLTGLLITHVDKIMLSRLLFLDAFGQYMLAVAITNLFPMLVMPVVSAAYPLLTKAVAAGDDKEVVRRYHIATELAALFLCPAAAVCALMPDVAVLAWTGDATIAANVGPLLRCLGIGMVCNSLLQIPFALQLAHGWTDLALKLNCIAFGVLFPAEILAAQHYGAFGAALAWSGVLIGLLPATVMLMHKRLLADEGMKWLWRGIFVPLACGLAASGVVAFFTPHGLSRLGAASALIACATAAFLSVLMSLPRIREILYEFRRTTLSVRIGD